MAQSTTDGELDPVATSGGSAAIEAATGLTAAAVTKTPTTETDASGKAAEYPAARRAGLEGGALEGRASEQTAIGATGSAGNASAAVKRTEPGAPQHGVMKRAATQSAATGPRAVKARATGAKPTADGRSASYGRTGKLIPADAHSSVRHVRPSSGGAQGRLRSWWGAFPAWERRALTVIVLFAGAMYGWEAAHATYHGFYAVAVKSMTTGWRAFVFGALDPNASITIDKIPGFLWPQALSAMVFGFHPWSLALPQGVEGLVTVLALHAAVRRWLGPKTGMCAAAIFALTPVVASLFGKVLEDAALTCLLVLAAAAWQRAVETGRLRSLVFCGVWVGLAFQAKMLQSWAVLPAFALAYLIAAPPRLLVRLRHTLVAGAVCLVVSLSWVIIATLTPAGDRPYVDGSTNNSAAAMVFGYNGLARFGSVGVSAAGTGSVAANQGTHFGGSSSGWWKLFQHELASQVGWLYPVALAGIAFALWRRGRGRTDVVRAGALMWTGWLLMTGLAMSAGSVPHSTYVVALAPPLAALAAYGLVHAVQLYRAPRRTRDRLILPVLTGVTLTWSVYLSAAFPRFLPGIALPLSAAAVTVVALALVVGRATGRRSGMTRWSAGLCCALMLAVPAAWSVSVFDPAYAGSSGNANAGGYQGGMHFGPRKGVQTRLGGRSTPAMFNPFNPRTSLDAAQSRLLSYLTDHRDGSRYLVATESWGVATPYILADTASVLPMGGFSGDADFPQPQQFQAMVRAGEVHYVLLTGGMRGRGTRSPSTRSASGTHGAKQTRAATTARVTDTSDLARVAALVAKSCRLVPAAAYGAVQQETAPLYRCG
ncbi:glycosyltransferase family 39 protein [Actinospica robiniae]|uniref:glycosyltransferase family 39 protein n=1 Tax=Actinospica robiniae TaxID=304901 RepID=UPI000412A66C|nr:glycosyltransferase family 39 protein [Actinospica robiniae]